MLSVKQELLAALADGLERLSPGAGDKAAFESPKVAALGDFACTAAMQLAKPLKLNPRQVAERLRGGGAGQPGDVRVQHLLFADGRLLQRDRAAAA
mgnify:CR=1 FL=1